MTTKVMKKFDTVEAGIENMIAAAIYDYGKFMKPDTEVRAKMNKEFAENFVIKEGNKYIKILVKNYETLINFV